jgi:hypothetical protein
VIDGEGEEDCDAAAPLSHAVVKHASVLERPPQSDGQRQVLVEGKSPRGLTYHCTDKAGYIYSSPLLICRVVLLLLR